MFLTRPIPQVANVQLSSCGTALRLLLADLSAAVTVEVDGTGYSVEVLTSPIRLSIR